MSGRHMRAMQRAGLTAEKTLRQVGRVPQIQVADLRAVSDGYAKEISLTRVAPSRAF
jgi:hypothetical protein